MSGTPGQYPFQSLRSSKYSEQISHQLLQRIVDGHFKPGERLPPERDLASIFNVSRVVVRESIGSLEAMGIVDVRQGRGTTVNPVDEWNTLDSQVLLLLHGDEVFSQLMETRQIIEPDMAALAAKRILDDELEALRLCSELPEDDSVEEHVERDMNFHLMIAKATHNPVLLMVLSSTSELLREGRRRIFNVPGELARARQWHHAIYEAIASRDADAAREAMAAHMEQVRLGLRSEKAK
jgi:GntR family transcriptional repressor for pyruvate dehydrogenase complex